MPSKSWSELLGSAARAAISLLSSSRDRSGAARTPSASAPSAPSTSAPRTPRPEPRTAPTTPRRAPGSTPRTTTGGRGTEPAAARGRYPGDYTGSIAPEYSPELDGDADPGEIVWTWVPYEEDHTQGKDRPVLVVGRDGAWLLALMLTSKDHSRDPRPPGADGPRWMDIGTGPWDARGRDSEVRLDRVLRIDPDQVRREGAIMDERTFRLITAQIG